MATGYRGSEVDDTTPIDVDMVLGDVLGAAQRSFPTLCLPPEVFVAYLRERVPPDLPMPVALRRLHTSYLCSPELSDRDVETILLVILVELDHLPARPRQLLPTIADVRGRASMGSRLFGHVLVVSAEPANPVVNAASYR